MTDLLDQISRWTVWVTRQEDTANRLAVTARLSGSSLSAVTDRINLIKSMANPFAADRELERWEAEIARAQGGSQHGR